MSSFAWRERRLEQLLSEHADAVAEYLERARAIPETRWLLPRGEGKWTPAQETRHLVLYYQAFNADLNGLARMALKGTALQRIQWRLFGLTQILWRQRIPVAVRAPQEARPEWDETPRDQLLAQLGERTREFGDLFTDRWRAEPRRRVRHPWFGDLKLDHAMRMSIVHTRHHAAFLAQSIS